jgi:formamidopyrimidine-DNA glycosylase
MPELPEVETIVRDLRKKIIGLKITDFWSDRDKPVRQAGGIKKFKKEITGRKIADITRRAKFIVIDIEGDKAMFIHQKISGHLMYGKWSLKNGVWLSSIKGPLQSDRQNQYIRYIWSFNNGHRMAMSDLRRFSRVILVKDRDISKLKEIRDLGPEPLEIKEKDFIKLFVNKRGKLKQVLMDPFFIVGIGNIYSDEILWDSGYHPLARVENLKEADLKKIFKSTVKILNKAIKAKGSSIDDYRTPSGEKGSYQEMEKAYQKTGEKCSKKDGGIIRRMVVGGRSAHYCDKHQKLI